MRCNLNHLLTLACLAFASFSVSGQIITTYAGTGIAGYSGDGGQATAGQMYSPFGLAVDDSGTLYIAEKINNIIRKVAPDGTISTYAGTGVAGYTGDGGPATNAQINTPYDIALDHSGNLYFTDNGNNKIRKIDKHGIISTVPIHVMAYCSGSCGVPAYDGLLVDPTGIAIDDSGTIYFSNGDFSVLKVDSENTASMFAGNCCYSYMGDGGMATAAALNHPIGIAIDHSGNVYIGDEGNNVVRKVNAAGIITTYAGNGAYLSFHGDGGQATAAGMAGPFGVTVDNAGNLYIQDIFNRRIRKVNTSGIITTVAGDGTAGYSGDGGPATAAEFYDCTGFAIDNFGNYFISDLWYSVVRKVTMPATLSITNNNVSGGSIALFPNPNRGEFYLQGFMNAPDEETAQIDVINIVGQSVYKNSVSLSNGNINAHVSLSGELPNGVYLLHVTSAGQRLVSKFVLER